jgi:acetylornithine deacetylase/succinyl-diaminopimelate desuccinylase-like protein
MALDLTETLGELVALPSVNPMGRPVSGPQFLEYRVTEYLERLFDRLGLPWQRQTVEPKRDNIVARFDGDEPAAEGGRLLLFEAHQDTVPVDGMTISPWSPQVRDGRLYGRGSCDIKGGMTAMLAALARLVEERPTGRPTVLMACTVNEEHGYSGVQALTRLWAQCPTDAPPLTPPASARGEGSSIFPRRPDVAVVAEPTGLQVVVAHKGAVRWRCHTHGRAAHSSQPQLGENAVYKMGPVLAAMQAYARDVAPRVAKHRLCGQATLSVGMIHGGLSVNTVPDRCTIEIDRRVLPGEQSLTAYRQVIDFVNGFPGVPADIEHEPPYITGAPLGDEDNGPLAEQLAAVGRSVLGTCQIVGVPYGTNAATIAASGVPAVVFGPGSIDQAHTADEWLSLAELSQASEILYRFARGG